MSQINPHFSRTIAEPGPAAPAIALSPSEAEVVRHLRSLRYGEVVVQLHDARIVQIERTERIRHQTVVRNGHS